MSWNVRSLHDDARGVAEALRALDADLVVLQEAPRLLLWRRARRLLAHRAGLRLLTRGRACGNLLLAGPWVRALGTSVVPLPHVRGLHRRAAATASVRVGGREVVLAGTHLDLDPAARLASARAVRAALPPGPLVLCADVNEQDDGPAWAALAHGLVDAGAGLGPTFPARAPRRRIDAVLVDPGLPVLAARVVPTGAASDHLALCVDLSGDGEPGGPVRR